MQQAYAYEPRAKNGAPNYMKQYNTMQYKQLNPSDKESPEPNHHETDRRASGSRRTSATGTRCSQIPAARTAHSAAALDPRYKANAKLAKTKREAEQILIIQINLNNH